MNSIWFGAVVSVGWFLLFAVTLMVLAYRRASLAASAVVLGVLLLVYWVNSSASVLWKCFGTVPWLLLALLNLRAFRERFVTRPFLKNYLRMLPSMSATEREALEAGTVWWDGELFTGGPDWPKLMSARVPRLTAEEQAFLDGPCERLCGMLDDWDITHRRADLPPVVWDFIKAAGFFAMIIPKRYGGLEFSAYAHSCVLIKIASRSATAASTIAVPNSLGPAELLLHYGTEAQKDHYLPRLARGDEVPCFALTGPRAGSDAASIPDTGVVCRGVWEGRDIVGIRLNFSKRYITLAPVATVIGLAFRLFDPDRLLGDKTDLGITCALIPRKTPGVAIGRRHFPLNVPFQNGPIQGVDVFVPVDAIIGGFAMAGQGWRMLVEQLSVGRCISLPSNTTGAAKAGVYASAAYARIRRQFNMPVGRFEGVEQVIARMAARTYIMDAARSVTAGAIDGGEKPSVPSAMLKYHATEFGRMVANDAMDVQGGKGICLGPKNDLGRNYQVVPVAITVEGANILTRSLILFGQGAIRCHPHVLEEMEAARDTDRSRGLQRFDRAISAHVGYTLANAIRTTFHGLTGARFAGAPADAPAALQPWFRQISRLSAALAFASDLSMLSMGGDLKRREKISARLGDILAYLYIATCALKRFESQGCPAEDRPLLEWAVRDALWKVQDAFAGVVANYPARPLAWLLRLTAFPFGWTFDRPTDDLGHQVARLLIAPTGARDRLTQSVFIPANPAEQGAALEAGLAATLAAEPIEARVRAAHKQGAFGLDRRANVRDIASVALERGVITAEEHAVLQRRNALRDQVIRVDDFPHDLSDEAEAAPSAAGRGVTELRGAAA